MSRSHKWKLSLLFSFISYSIVLFGLIVVDVFWKSDFDFKEVAMITGIYMGLLIIFMFFAVFVFRTKQDA